MVFEYNMYSSHVRMEGLGTRLYVYSGGLLLAIKNVSNY